MKKTAVLAGGVALVLAACAMPGTNTGQGRVRMAVQWPQRGFSTQAIPDGTQTISIQITGLGLEQPVVRNLSRSGPDVQTLEIELPLGDKRVEVKALSTGGDTLARDQRDVSILANQTTRMEMSLAPVPLPTPTPAVEGSKGGSGGSGSGSPAEGPAAGPRSGPGSGPAPAGEQTLRERIAEAVANGSPLPPALRERIEERLSGGSGGSGGGGSAPNLPPVSVQANPETISGKGYPTEIRLVFADPAKASDVLQRLSAGTATLTWSCFDELQNPGCGSFSQGNGSLHMFWTSPAQNGNYKLKAELSDGAGNFFAAQIQVTVLGGDGTVQINSGGFDGGEAGGN